MSKDLSGNLFRRRTPLASLPLRRFECLLLWCEHSLYPSIQLRGLLRTDDLLSKESFAIASIRGSRHRMYLKLFCQFVPTGRGPYCRNASGKGARSLPPSRKGARENQQRIKQSKGHKGNPPELGAARRGRDGDPPIPHVATHSVRRDVCACVRCAPAALAKTVRRKEILTCASETRRAGGAAAAVAAQGPHCPSVSSPS